MRLTPPLSLRWELPFVCSADEPHYLVMVNALLAGNGLDVRQAGLHDAHAGSLSAGRRLAAGSLDSAIADISIAELDSLDARLRAERRPPGLAGFVDKARLCLELVPVYPQLAAQ